MSSYVPMITGQNTKTGSVKIAWPSNTVDLYSTYVVEGRIPSVSRLWQQYALGIFANTYIIRGLDLQYYNYEFRVRLCNRFGVGEPSRSVFTSNSRLTGAARDYSDSRPTKLATKSQKTDALSRQRNVSFESFDNEPVTRRPRNVSFDSYNTEPTVHRPRNVSFESYDYEPATYRSRNASFESYNYEPVTHRPRDMSYETYDYEPVTYRSVPLETYDYEPYGPRYVPFDSYSYTPTTHRPRNVSFESYDYEPITSVVTQQTRSQPSAELPDRVSSRSGSSVPRRYNRWLGSSYDEDVNTDVYEDAARCVGLEAYRNLGMSYPYSGLYGGYPA